LKKALLSVLVAANLLVFFLPAEETPELTYIPGIQGPGEHGIACYCPYPFNPNCSCAIPKDMIVPQDQEPGL
jgi:hypothetical protein